MSYHEVKRSNKTGPLWKHNPVKVWLVYFKYIRTPKGDFWSGGHDISLNGAKVRKLFSFYVC